jgi:hypothetical protein
MRGVGIAVIATFVQLTRDQYEVRLTLVRWQPVEWTNAAAALVEDGWLRLQGVIDDRTCAPDHHAGHDGSRVSPAILAGSRYRLLAPPAEP